MAYRAVLATGACVGLGFISLRSSQHTRKLLVGPLLGAGAYAFWHSGSILAYPYYAGKIAWFLLFFMQHMVYTLFLAQYKLPDRSWRTAYYWLFNARWIGTNQSTVMVRRRNRSLAQGQSTNNSVALTRMQFTLRRLGVVLLKYAVMVIYYEIIDMPTLLQFQQSDYSPSKRILIRRIIRTDPTLDLKRESLIRTWVVFTWLLEDYISLSSMHDLFAVFFVGILGLDHPDDWPPLYGHLSDVTSLRTWYSQFWQTLLYRYSVNTGNWAIDKCFGPRVGKQTRTRRILLASFVFTLSAMNHLATEYVIYGILNWWSFGWFLAQPLIFVVEDIVGVLVRTYLAWTQNLSQSTVSRWVGKLWVFSLFYWGILKFAFRS
ncbi:hypothetical protein K461DRAFT_297979 [Myriangium duriaei CBS 260.36]|uniref:Wax synthase domain-containing protein n=1 Tax=Myriangium duriaei CBS 260.36 TaxID=1168546 RepID=A0A9P4MCC0_9PEZI|nr:hypothetical protein K461DRAFT_297979 [Myriangium duriaei CBS 260.36]